MRLQRLKDKLGNRSNASAEVEYDEAMAWLVGEEGRGLRTIIEMVNMTRLDCVLITATGMRAGVTAAAHHAGHRMAFGRKLADQPLMASVLADLVIESEATTMAAFRLAEATDRAVRGDEQEIAFRRLALAATKYWVCKRARTCRRRRSNAWAETATWRTRGCHACTGRPRCSPSGRVRVMSPRSTRFVP